MPLISIFENTTNTTPYKNVDIMSVLASIKGGAWRDKIKKLRSMPLEEYKELKKGLYAVTFSGTFTERQAENIDVYSHMIVIDIDHVQLSQIRAYKEAFQSDPYIYSAFISPSNEGLKILFKVDSDKNGHNDAFNGIKKYLEDKYAMSVDKTGKDICRLCYVSYDPELYLNENSEAWHTDVSAPSSVQITDTTKWKDAKFIGRKVTTEVQYIFNVAKKWTEKSFQCVPGSYNNYIHYLSCILNRCGVVISDTMLLIDGNYILPDKKWTQSVRSAYFHNKSEHNTVPVYELEKEANGIKRIEEEKSYSDNDLEQDIIKTAILLLNKNVDIPDVVTIMRNYAFKLVQDGFIDLDEEGLKSLLGRAWNNSDQAKVNINTLNALTGADMLMSIMANIGVSGSMTSGFAEFDAIMRGGPQAGNFYGVIGVGGTFKSIFVQYMACENAKKGVPVLYLNGEMSSRQYYERLFNKELHLDFSEELESGRLNAGNYHEYSKRIDDILGHNLFCVTGSGFTKEEIINTISSTEKQTGKRIKMVIMDGLSQMADVNGNEITSAIANSAIAKEIAKESDVAFVALIHTSGAVSKHHRQTSENVRGGSKIVNNMDSFYCTSLIIDPATLDCVNDDILYQPDKLFLRYNDKRGSGEILSKIIQVSRPLKMEVMPYNTDTQEIKIDK